MAHGVDPGSPLHIGGDECSGGDERFQRGGRLARESGQFSQGMWGGNVSVCDPRSTSRPFLEGDIQFERPRAPVAKRGPVIPQPTSPKRWVNVAAIAAQEFRTAESRLAAHAALQAGPPPPVKILRRPTIMMSSTRPPNDKRGFIHKSRFGGFIGGLVGDIIPGGLDDFFIDKFTGGKFTGGGNGGQPAACGPGYERVAGQCVPSVVPGRSPGGGGFDPTPGVMTPAEKSVAGPGATGFQAPFQSAVTHLQCPRFGNGKVGILWMNKWTGQIVCLPRGTNGAGFGLVRKNKPRAKAYITRAQYKRVTDRKKDVEKAKEFAKATGLHMHKKK